jgi:hypothetical protein
MIQGSHIVTNFLDIDQGDTRFLPELIQQQVGQRGLGPFDHGRKNRFFSDVHVQEKG